MKFPKHFQHLAVVFAAAVFVSAARANPVQEGVEAFAAGDHAAASRSFQLALDQHGPSAQLYFNRGLAAWHAGEIPQAVVSLLRAEALDSSQKQASEVLAAVAAEKNLVLPQTSELAGFARRIGIGPLWVAGSMISWAAIFVLVLGLFREAKRAWVLAGGLALLLLGSGLLGMASVSDPLFASRNLAVIESAKPVAARNNPVETAGTIENLPPGSVVGILSQRGNWAFCELPGGKEGWLGVDSLLAVFPDKKDS